MRRLIRLGIPGVIAGGVTQINIVIGTVIASLQNGAVSHLYYADRVYELPLAIVGIAIGVVLLPDVSRHLRAGNHEAVMDSQNRSLEFAMLLTRAGRRRARRDARRRSSRAVRARRLHRGRHAGHRLRAGDFRARPAVVRPDQGVLACLFRARGHRARRCATPPSA